MLCGHEKKRQNRRPLCANKGFVSMYALILLQLLLVFVMVMSARVITFAHVFQSNDHVLMDIAILHEIHQKCQNGAFDKDDSHGEEEMEDDAIDLLDEEDTTQEDVKEPLSSWDMTYHDITIHFEKVDANVDATYSLGHDQKSMHVTLDAEQTVIMSYAYDT